MYMCVCVYIYIYRLLYAIEDDYERERHIVEYNEIMKNAGIPPTSTAMFNSICYELVSELADRCQVYSLYWYKSAHTDAEVCVQKYTY